MFGLPWLQLIKITFLNMFTDKIINRAHKTLKALLRRKIKECTNTYIGIIISCFYNINSWKLVSAWWRVWEKKQARGRIWSLSSSQLLFFTPKFLKLSSWTHVMSIFLSGLSRIITFLRSKLAIFVHKVIGILLKFIRTNKTNKLIIIPQYRNAFFSKLKKSLMLHSTRCLVFSLGHLSLALRYLFLMSSQTIYDAWAL